MSYVSDSNGSSSSDEDDTGGGALKALFKTTDHRRGVFYFKGILLRLRPVDPTGYLPPTATATAAATPDAMLSPQSFNITPGFSTMITFVYSYNHEFDLESHMHIPGEPLASTMNTLIAIGMVKLMWFYMGFGTERVVINKSIGLKEEQLPFWTYLFNNVLLEYLYMNKFEYKIQIEISSANLPFGPSLQLKSSNSNSNSNSCSDSSSGGGSKPNLVLVPLGGGKDSLVAWKVERDLKNEVALLYIENEVGEFDRNEKTKELVDKMRRTDGKCHFFKITHDFDCATFDRKCRSSIKLSGHPWAALVIFDSYLIYQMYTAHLGIYKISLGFEKSADEGNGVFWLGHEVNHQFDKSAPFLHEAKNYITSYLDGGSDSKRGERIEESYPTYNSAYIAAGASTSVVDGSDIALCEVADRKSLVVSKRDEVEISSMLCDMWEIKITEIFCRSPELRQFHNCFLSCNTPTNNYLWCMNCEKCYFIFLLMSAWLPPSEVTHIFEGENLFYLSKDKTVSIDGNKYSKATVESVFDSLLGHPPTPSSTLTSPSSSLSNLSTTASASHHTTHHKPFECVGTPTEARCALELAAIRYLYRSDLTSDSGDKNGKNDHDDHDDSSDINNERLGDDKSTSSVFFLLKNVPGLPPLLQYLLTKYGLDADFYRDSAGYGIHITSSSSCGSSISSCSSSNSVGCDDNSCRIEEEKERRIIQKYLI